MPELPSHIWEDFIDLHNGRGSGAMGPARITHEGILAWSQLTGVTLTRWQLSLIKALDNVWLRVQSEASLS